MPNSYPITQSIKDRFEGFISMEPMTGCWLWTGATNNKGYGLFWMLNNLESAHRAAWAMYKGPIPDRINILHKCDIRACVNPWHLFTGTNADNTHDAQKKGRIACGERSGKSKLTDDKVFLIRKDTRLQQTIADELGVRNETISRIKSRKLWSHLP